MSPLSLRRYRAQRLLEREFKALEGRVLATVSRRLRAAGADLEACDLEACYALAWQGLYTALLDGQEVANPAGWLVVSTFRRAIDERRARARAERGFQAAEAQHCQEHDLAAEIDDRARLRELFEGLRARLTEREREAASLCYLQGLPRVEAAARMGVSEARMRKLMEGRGPGRPGVAAKVGALVETIRDGRWCEEQGSLMRGLAFGILDPEGERYQLAVVHRSQCPACRAYVASLRGLAAVLPPVLLPGGLGAAALAHVAEAHLLAGGAAAGSGLAGGAGVGAQAGRGIGGALSASGAAGAGGAAGGGWLAASAPFGAKLAVSCLLALGAGAGCVALETGGAGVAPRMRAHRHLRPAALTANAPRLPSTPPPLAAVVGMPPAGTGGARRVRTAQLPPSLAGAREFGPERPAAGAVGAPPAERPPSGALAKAASASHGSESPARSSAPVATGASGASAGVARAAREFSPG